MIRPQTYARDDVVRAARELFWERGYEATSLSQLEERTGLNRSSLYQAFGSKRALFDEAMRYYLRDIVEPRLAGLLDQGAALAEVVSYLRLLGDALRADRGPYPRGCLIVNTVAEMAGRDRQARDDGLAYRDLVGAALAHAMRGAGDRGEIELAVADARARVLTATVIGILLTARLDPTDAADVAHAAADEVAAW